jgi:outer membrane receptor for ferrienterochelin and colicins
MKMLKRASWWALLWCLMPAPAGAEEVAFATGDESILFREIPTVYGASKYEQKVTDAPASVSIVTASDIQKYGYRTLADVLRSVRGLYVTYDRNYSYLGVRGFGRPGDYNSRVLLLVDGHRINDDIYGQGLIGREFPVDVDLIDRVEVIRGPGSSLYGTGAFFAVINVVTRGARLFNGAEVSAEAGDLATAKGRASYGQRFENGLEMMLSASGYRSSGQRRLYYPEFDSPQTHNGIARDLDAERTEQVFANLAFGDFNLRLVHGSRRKEFPTASFETVFNDPRAHTVDDRQYVDLSYQRRLDDSDVSGRIYLDSYRYTGDYPYDLPPVVVNQDSIDGRWWGAEYKYTTRFGDRHRATLGAEYVDNYRQFQENAYVDPNVSLLDSRRRSRTWALYLQDEIAISPTLSLNAGLRYDQLYTLGSTTNPRLALIYNAIPDTTLKLLYGTAFRAPNAYELYFYNTGGIGFKAPGSLAPEKIRTTELVLERNLTEHLRGVVSAYRNEITNLISLHTDPADGQLVFANLDRARTRGVEFEIDGQWGNGVEGRFSYTWQHTTNALTDKVLSNSPQRMAKLNLSAPLLERDIFAGLELQYVSSRRTVQDTTLGGFVLANLTVFRRSLHNGLELSGSVYNLFDKKYADTGSEEHLQAGIVQDGRTFRVKLTLPL